MLAELAHWCSSLGTLLLNEKARVRICLFFFFSSEIFKVQFSGQRSLLVQESETGTGAVATVFNKTLECSWSHACNLIGPLGDSISLRITLLIENTCL